MHVASAVSLTIQLAFFFGFLFLIWLSILKTVCHSSLLNLCSLVCFTKPALAISSKTHFVSSC